MHIAISIGALISLITTIDPSFQSSNQEDFLSIRSWD